MLISKRFELNYKKKINLEIEAGQREIAPPTRSIQDTKTTFSRN